MDAVIDGLDIDSWEAVQKPSGLAETDELSYDYGGTQVSATLYDDPGYVTVDVDGQEVTLKIPESASQYLQYLQ